jgi:hypothetical protein
MHDAARQLEMVRGRAKLWLTILQLLRFVSAVVPVLVVLALVDWALKLPGWLRLVIGLFVLIECVVWLSTRLYRASRFRPALGDLALRAERVYPQLAGVLASCVEFQVGAAGDDEARGPHHNRLMRMTIDRARTMLDGVRLARLIDLSSVARWFAASLLAMAVLASGVIYAPGMTRTAMARWMAPLGPTEWPRRVILEDATPVAVCPVDAPVRLVTHIQRGFKHGMRVRVNYRMTDAAGVTGEWQEVLMTEQGLAAAGSGEASFERLIDLPPAVVRSINRTPDSSGQLQYTFQAGDGLTPPGRVTLVARPAVAEVNLSTDPPVYAAGLVSPQAVALHEQSGQIASASALIGSRVSLEVVLNKPVPVTPVGLAAALPGLAETIGMQQVAFEPRSADESQSNRFTATFTLTETFSTRMHVTDTEGLENLSQRRYRIEAIEDGPPSVSITEPVADESVLASAELAVTAVAQDDVGLESLEVVGAVVRRVAKGQPVEEPMPRLAESSGRQPTLDAQAVLALPAMQLRAGDTLVLHGVARDVYELDGQRHDPVRSSPRTLRIIDEPTLIAQLRSELAGLRQQVVRLEQTQQRIQSEQPPSVTLPQQEQVTQRLDAQTSLLERLDERMQRNRLDDAPMREVIDRADTLVRRARGQSSDAVSRLRAADENPDDAEALERAANEQQAVRQTLGDLAELLDQGRDVLTLKLQLQQLKTQQSALATDTRELLPRTIGQELDQLEEDERERLEDLRRRQAELAEQARTLTRQMQLTADALARQGERDQDRAAAEALAEAAAIGQRQGLEESMSQSSESMQRNQLSQSGQQQDEALNTLERMLEEMGTQERRRQEILRRRLRELSALIRRLIERQTAHADALEAADAGQVAPLEPGQVSIRRATMGAQQQAGGSKETAEVASALAEAVREQGAAVGALRNGNRAPALAAERRAVDHLKKALEELNKITEDNAAQEAREKRRQLREAYLQHAERQDALRKSVRQAGDVGPVDRRRRAELVALAGGQSELQQAIARTGEEVAQTLVFERMHERIGTASSRVVTTLRRGVADAAVLSDQRTIATTLRAMADALKEDPTDSPFAGGGGGGGGGGGAPPAAVPPLAELRLIRGLQEGVYNETKEAEATTAGQTADTMKQRMLELSTQQRELSSLGKRLIEQMKQPPEAPIAAPEGADTP